jgi:hypothetical protein
MPSKADTAIARTIGIDTGKNTLHVIGLDEKRQRQFDFGLCVECFFGQSFIMARACSSASSRDPMTNLPFISTPAG